MNKRPFFLINESVRQRAADFLAKAPDGWLCVFSEPIRTSGQNAKFHAICSDIAKSGFEWAGKKRTAEQWKVLLVSGHAHATKENVELIAGLENEYINIRESTALMSIKRGSSLLEYTTAFCANNGIKIMAPEYEEQ